MPCEIEKLDSSQANENAEVGVEYQIAVSATYYTDDRGFEIRVDPAERQTPNQDPFEATDLPTGSTAVFEVDGPIDGRAYWRWVAPHDGRLRLRSSSSWCDPPRYRPLVYFEVISSNQSLWPTDFRPLDKSAPLSPF